jgi:hypothetical protein
MKTSELTGQALDWAVAKCEGVINGDDLDLGFVLEGGYTPSTDWAQGGTIIVRERIEWQWLPATDKQHQYGARKPSLGGLNRTFCMDGPTVLIAAMRCYVASKLGDEVDVPNEIVEVVK